MDIRIKYLFLVFFIVVGGKSFSQINGGNDTTICFGNPVFLDAVVDIPSNYTQIFFDDADKVHDVILNIGFNFKFFEQQHTQFVIAPNGWIGFNHGDAGTDDPYNPQEIPSTAPDSIVPKNCIMGPWQDWYPQVFNGSYVGFETVGDILSRKLVVSFFNVPITYNPDSLGIFQIILSEVDDAIEFHITNKPDRSIPPSDLGLATLGIHNQLGTIGFSPPGRNGTRWRTENEAWRFERISETEYTVQPIPYNPIIIGELSGVSWYRNKYTQDSLISTGEMITVYPQTTTDYLAVVTLNEVVDFIDTVTITVNQLPIADAGPNVTILPGTSTQLHGNGIGGSGVYNGFLWEPANMLNDPPDFQDPLTIDLYNTQAYILSIVDDQGCESQNTDEVVVIVENSPLFALVVTPDPDKTVCSGDSIELQVQAFGGDILGGYSFSWWSSPPGFTASDTIVFDTPLTTTTYYVEVTDVLDSTFVDSITIQVPTIAPAIVGEPEVCEFRTATIYSTDLTGNNFTWSVTGVTPQGSHANQNIFYVDWGESGNGYVQVVEINDQYNCFDTALLGVTVLPNPTPEIVGIDVFCNGDSTSFITPLNQPNTYEWTVFPTNSGQLDYIDSNLVSVNWLNNGFSTLYVTETTSFGCKGIDFYDVLINPSPDPVVSGPASVCIYDESSFFTSYVLGDVYEWYISPPGIGDFVSPYVGNEVLIKWNNPGMAYISVKEEAETGCDMVSMDFEVLINEIPEISAIPDNMIICRGDTDTINMKGANFYYWEPTDNLTLINDSSWSIFPFVDDHYEVVGVNTVSGCRDTIDFDVSVIPVPYVDLGSNKYLFPNQPVEIYSGGQYDTYEWNTGSTDTSITAQEAGKYYLDVTKNGCASSDTVFVLFSLESLPIPNAFTPNEDGINDRFNVVINYPDRIFRFNMQIYSRWGELIFETNDITEGWDGTIKGNACESGAYTWFIIFEEENPYSAGAVSKQGTVVLLR